MSIRITPRLVPLLAAALLGGCAGLHTHRDTTVAEYDRMAVEAQKGGQFEAARSYQARADAARSESARMSGTDKAVEVGVGAIFNALFDALLGGDPGPKRK